MSRGHLFVVADGMGAHAAGELASEMATERIPQHYLGSADDDTAVALRRAIEKANADIHQRGRSNPEFFNMGTTASSLVIFPDGALVGHVGDSRVYRLRNSVLEQLTFDHSLVWEMEACRDFADLGPSPVIPKNVITRSLGPHESVTVDIEGPFDVRQNDQFLICSDGLTGLVEDAEIGVLMGCLPEEKAARVLVDLANLRGGPDNTTVVIVRAEDNFGPNSNATSTATSARDRRLSPLLVVTSVLCFVVAIVLATLGLTGPMVVANILGLLTALTAAAVAYRSSPTMAGSPVGRAGGKGPYRRYEAAANGTMYDRLGTTVAELREAAQKRNWLIDWSAVDKHQKDGAEALKSDNFARAIACQAEAIVETMNQLREQHNRAANETAIDY